MINRLMRFFSKEPLSDEGNACHDIRVAVCALFLEMSHIDGEFDQEERAHILSTLKSEYGLSERDAADLMDAANEELSGSIDLWRFTNLVNQYYSREEKLDIIETVWNIAYKDGRLDRHEDYLVHKLAQLLRLSHQELIDAKLRAKS